MSIITLLTDFGMYDPFAGQMKGVILSINPSCQIIDITHEIEQFNIKKGALSLGFSYRYFPVGTIHIAVVDPGVGSGRRGIIVCADGHFFVGPDNGIFSYIYQRCSNGYKVFHLTNKDFFLRSNSSTFHGRDVFAGVAAGLSYRLPIERFGDEIDDFMQIDIPKPQIIDNNAIKGVILYIDRFGNAITNIDETTLKISNNVLSGSVVFREQEISLTDCYGHSYDNTPSALINSSGMLELFIKEGSIAERYSIKESEPVTLILYTKLQLDD